LSVEHGDGHMAIPNGKTIL